jgi:hypothetical protein
MYLNKPKKTCAKLQVQVFLFDFNALLHCIFWSFL